MKNNYMNGANLGTIMSNNNRSREDFIDQSILNGVPVDKAMLLGAEYDLKQSQAAHHNYEVEMGKQKAVQQMLVQQRLNELGVEDPLDVEGNFKRFVGLGLEPTNAMSIAKGLAQVPLQQQKAGLEKQESQAKTIRDQEETLRKEYIAMSKPFQEVSRAYSKISKALTRENPSAADDMAGLYGLIKLYDPTTGVRESEYANVGDLKGVPEWLRVAYNKAATGELLTPEMRQRIYRTATDLYMAEKGANQKIQSQYRALSERAGINPDNVLLDYNSLQDEEEFTAEEKERARWEQLKAIKERRGF